MQARPRTPPRPPSGCPPPPQSLNAVAGDGRGSITWNAPVSDGGTPITSYRLRVLLNGVQQSTIDLVPASTCAAGLCSYNARSLTNGNRYVVELSALNAAGQGAAVRVPLVPMGLPGAPTGLGATGGVRSIALTWAPPASNGGSPITSYLLTATAGSSVITKALSSAAVCPAGGCAFTLTGLANGTAYALMLATRTSVGPSATASASATTFDLPSAPQNLVATAGNGQAALTWGRVALNGGTPLTGYRLRVLVSGAVVSTLEVPLSRCGSSGCIFNVTGLTNGTRYGLRLTSVNAVGESVFAATTVTPHS